VATNTNLRARSDHRCTRKDNHTRACSSSYPVYILSFARVGRSQEARFTRFSWSSRRTATPPRSDLVQKRSLIFNPRGAHKLRLHSLEPRSLMQEKGVCVCSSSWQWCVFLLPQRLRKLPECRGESRTTRDLNGHTDEVLLPRCQKNVRSLGKPGPRFQPFRRFQRAMVASIINLLVQMLANGSSCYTVCAIYSVRYVWLLWGCACMRRVYTLAHAHSPPPPAP
jgi:hypothetical protein